MRNIFVVKYLIIFALMFKNGHLNAQVDTAKYRIYRIEPVHPYIPILKTESLVLTNIIEGFNYEGNIYCDLLIDTLEKKVAKVYIVGLKGKNKNKECKLRFERLDNIKELPKMVQLIYPFIDSIARNTELEKTKLGTPEMFERFYYYSIVFNVK
jgi:hypothetical protein